MNRTHESWEGEPAIEYWRKIARRYREKMGLDDSFEQAIRRVFEKAVVDAYWKPLHSFVLEELAARPDAVAGQINVDKATVYRWLQTGENWREPALKNYCAIAVAYDVDFRSDVSLPSGVRAAISAYRETLIEIETSYLGRNDDWQIRDDQLLCLFFLVRNDEWIAGRESKDQSLLDRAAEAIIRHVEVDVPDSMLHSRHDIEEVVHDAVVSWLLLESVVKHDWLFT